MEEYAEAAKARQLNVDEAMILHELLYSDDAQRRQLAAVLLRRRGAARMTAVNITPHTVLPKK